jgi:hypothetical protein
MYVQHRTVVVNVLPESLQRGLHPGREQGQGLPPRMPGVTSDVASMLWKRVNKWLSASALYLASLWTCAWATVYELPADSSAVLGTDIRVKVTDQDTLLDIAHRYGLGYPEIIRANRGVDIWLPGEGREILLPTRRILPPAPD